MTFSLYCPQALDVFSNFWGAVHSLSCSFYFLLRLAVSPKTLGATFGSPRTAKGWELGVLLFSQVLYHGCLTTFPLFKVMKKSVPPWERSFVKNVLFLNVLYNKVEIRESTISYGFASSKGAKRLLTLRVIS